MDTLIDDMTKVSDATTAEQAYADIWKQMDLLAFPFAGCCVEPGTTYRRTKLCRSVLAYVFFVHIL